jgi:hypothetical protein
MKTNLILSALLVGTFFSACKKTETKVDEPVVTPTPTPAVVYGISKDSTYDGTANNTQVRLFTYNSGKKLVRVQYKQGTSTTYGNKDTLIYNGSGQLSKVESTSKNGTVTVTSTNTYNYTSDLLTSVNENGSNSNGAFIRTRTFTYSGGKLSGQAVTYSSGSGGSGGPENITSIVFSGNNMSSADLTGNGNITFTSETTAPNPYYGLNLRSDDFINNFNQNNITKGYLTATPTMILLNNTYTYADGRVATITDISKTPNRITVISHKIL